MTTIERLAVLHIDDEKVYRELVGGRCERNGLTYKGFDNVQDFTAEALRSSPQVLVIDGHLGHHPSFKDRSLYGPEVLYDLRELRVRAPAIFYSAKLITVQEDINRLNREKPGARNVLHPFSFVDKGIGSHEYIPELARQLMRNPSP